MTMATVSTTDPALAGVRLLSIRDVAALLAVHPRTIWRLVATGVLPPPVRLGRRTLRWRLSDIERALQAQQGWKS